MATTQTETRRLTTAFGWLAAALLALGACSDKLPPTTTPGSCRDQCETLNCPGGTHCTLSRNCAATCEPDPLSPK